MDSVHFFHPRQFRTAVYHEILIGYLDYVKSLGYVDILGVTCNVLIVLSSCTVSHRSCYSTLQLISSIQ